MNEKVGGRMLEELHLPLAVVATRLRDRRLVLFDRRDTGLAVRASSADPDRFDAVRIGDERYARERMPAIRAALGAAGLEPPLSGGPGNAGSAPRDTTARTGRDVESTVRQRTDAARRPPR
ncbi:MAG: hypothetical protein NDI88_08035 [Lysobacter sp.]|nr:hypothetical protein [Lysobacter sp.]